MARINEIRRKNTNTKKKNQVGLISDLMSNAIEINEK